MPLDEYGNEIQEEEEPQIVLPERKNKYAGLWDVPGSPTTIQIDNLRPDGTRKGMGFLGPLQRPDGKISTELSIGVNFDGKETLIPTLVPTLTKDEINDLLTDGPITDSIRNKAIEHARQRMALGKNPFAEITEEPVKINKYSGIWDSVPTPPPMPPKKSPREMMELATKAGRIPSTNIVKDLVKKYTEPGYVSRMGTGEYWKAAGGNLLKSAREFVPGMAKLAAETIEPIIRPGHFIIERGMERVAAKKAKEMGVEPTKGAEGKTWLPVKNLADLALWGPKTLAKVIQDPVGMIENQPLDVLFLASIGLKRPLTKALDVNPLSSKDFGGILKEVATEHPEFQIPDATRTALVHIGTKLAERPVGFYITPEGKAISSAVKPIELTKPGAIKTGAMPKEGVAPIPDTAGVIPKEQMPPVTPPKLRKPGPGEVKGLGIEFVNDKGEPISRAEAFRGKQARIEPSAEGPGKIKMVVAPPPEVAEQPPMVRDFFEKIKEAKRLTPKQKNLYSIERRKRLARAMEAGRKIGGRAGYEAQQKALSGLLERVDFEPLKLTPEHADALFQYIEDSPAVLGFEKIATKNGLMKMLGEKGAGIPQPKELSLLKDVFGPEITTTTIGGKPWWMRAWELGIDTIGISRAAITSADLSFGLRQGIMYMARHPIKFLKDFPKQFKWFFSDKASKIVLDDIRTRENYPLAREAGLDIIGKEEPFQSRFAEKIPIIKESSRAYTTFASKMRMDAFDSRIENLQRMGINLHENLELAKKEAMLINTVTGRGQLKRLAPIQKEINAAFFSPHLALSRLNMLNPIWYIKLPKLTRIEALKYAASFASYGAVMLGLATVAGLKVGWEPTSADFLKIKIGDTRIDPFGGFSQYIRLFFQLKENKITSSTSGKVMKLGEGYKPTTRFDLLFRFGEAKEAPAFSFATGFLKGQNWIGEKFELGKETTNRFVPMVIQDFVDLYKEEPDLLPLGFLGIFGIGIQTYGPNSYKKRHGQRTSLQW